MTAILVISVFALFTSAVAGADDPPCTCGDICVNETGWWRAGGDFYASNTPTQHAIDNANEGNTICVQDGTYTENVDVNMRLTIRSENGSASTIVNAADSMDHVFDVSTGYVNISGFTVKGATYSGYAGIYLNNVDHCNISGNDASDNDFGIVLSSSSSNTITNNYASYNNNMGIGLFDYSRSNTITGNNASYNNMGIGLFDYSRSNTITGNNASYNSGGGVALAKSGNNTLRNNVMSGNDYNFEAEGLSYSELDNDIDISNLVDGKPIYYLVDASGTVIDLATNAGTVYCIHCDNVTVKDLTLTNNGDGIHFYNTSNSRIENNCISQCFDGIRLWSSSNNIITGNSVRDVGSGIVLSSSSSNTITNNYASYNWFVGIGLFDYSRSNIITGNNASYNFGPRSLVGIGLDKSGNNTLRNNLMSGNSYNFEAEGWSYSELDNDIDTSNLVDGKPIYYLVDASGTVIDLATNAGTVYCINCDNVTVKDLNLTSNGHGICFYNTSSSIIKNNHIEGCVVCISLLYSSNNTVTGNNVGGSTGIRIWRSSSNTITGNKASGMENTIILEGSDNNVITGNSASGVYAGIFLRDSSNNTITNNNASNSAADGGIFLSDSDNNTIAGNTASNNVKVGVHLEDSVNNTITGNTATSNNEYGICLGYSSNNLIYNNYFNNTNNAYDDGNNIWNITKTLGTNIIGGPYLGGNYWSDYAGKDLDGDGLGDTLIPYNSSGNIANGGDYLPLVPVQKPTVSITTDKFIYKTGDTMTITIDISNPTEDTVTFEWYWGVPQSDIWLLVTSLPIPAGYNDAINISFSNPNWGSTPSGSVFYVQLLDGSGEVLDADVAWWASSPSPGRFMEAMSVDLSKEIAKIIEKVELPM